MYGGRAGTVRCCVSRLPISCAACSLCASVLASSLRALLSASSCRSCRAPSRSADHTAVYACRRAQLSGQTIWPWWICALPQNLLSGSSCRSWRPASRCTGDMECVPAAEAWFVVRASRQPLADSNILLLATACA